MVNQLRFSLAPSYAVITNHGFESFANERHSMRWVLRQKSHLARVYKSARRLHTSGLYKVTRKTFEPPEFRTSDNGGVSIALASETHYRRPRGIMPQTLVERLRAREAPAPTRQLPYP